MDFFGNGTLFHCHIANTELFRFSAFHSRTEAFWKEEEDKLKLKFDEMLATSRQESYEEILHDHAWEHYQNITPHIHRESLLISLYSFLEHQLTDLCDKLSVSVDNKIKLKDLHGKGVEQAKLYLTKIVELDFSVLGGSWPYIQDISQVRNLIVHNGGKLPSDSTSRWHKIIEKYPNLKAAETGYLSVEPEFIDDLINALHSFFHDLDGEVQRYVEGYLDRHT